MDRSRLIWAFVRNNLGERHLASLYADLDLPLQLVTLRRNEGVLASAGADWGADLGGLSGWPDDLVGEENDEVGEAAE